MIIEKHIINYNKKCLNQTDKKGKILSRCFCKKCRTGGRVWTQDIICGAAGGFETREDFKKRINGEV